MMSAFSLRELDQSHDKWAENLCPSCKSLNNVLLTCTWSLTKCPSWTIPRYGCSSVQEGQRRCCQQRHPPCPRGLGCDWWLMNFPLRNSMAEPGEWGCERREQGVNAAKDSASAGDIAAVSRDLRGGAWS